MKRHAFAAGSSPESSTHCVTSTEKLVVDLNATTFPGAAGIIALLVGGHSATQRGASYRIINLDGIVYRVSDITDTLT